MNYDKKITLLLAFISMASLANDPFPTEGIIDYKCQGQLEEHTADVKMNFSNYFLEANIKGEGKVYASHKGYAHYHQMKMPPAAHNITTYTLNGFFTQIILKQDISTNQVELLSSGSSYGTCTQVK